MRTRKTEMVRTCREKDRARCSDENIEVSGHWMIGRPKLRWTIEQTHYNYPQLLAITEISPFWKTLASPLAVAVSRVPLSPSWKRNNLKVQRQSLGMLCSVVTARQGCSTEMDKNLLVLYQPDKLNRTLCHFLIICSRTS